MDNLERIKEGMERALTSYEVAKLIYVEPLAKMMLDDPEKGIRSIFESYNKGLDSAYTDENGVNARAFIESLAGGPAETVPWAVYNSVGAAYPYLERKHKDMALGEILNILDGINSQYVQITHTPGIREPLLLADVCLTRWLYWPGLGEGMRIVRDNKNFIEFSENMLCETGEFDPIKIKNEFTVAYTILHPKFCKWGEQYAEFAQDKTPEFLDRVLKAIAAISFSRGDDCKYADEDISPLPKVLHEKIYQFRDEKDWADYTKFK